MAVGGNHPDYDATLAQWSQAPDVLSGEDAVKAAGFLPCQRECLWMPWRVPAVIHQSITHALGPFA